MAQDNILRSFIFGLSDYVKEVEKKNYLEEVIFNKTKEYIENGFISQYGLNELLELSIILILYRMKEEKNRRNMKYNEND